VEALRRVLTAAAAALVLQGMVFAPHARARTTCSYAGPPANVLTVTVPRYPLAGEIGRRGTEITVNEHGQRPRACAGGTPTVLNTDTIKVRLRGPAAFVRLGGGPFAPGATAETSGASEIEVEISSKGGFVEVIGTPGADAFRWGPAGDHLGLNLNPRAAGDTDLDVTLEGGDPLLRESFLVAAGAGGNDSIDGYQGHLIRGGLFSRGGRGRDFLQIPAGAGGILEGGPGADTLLGANGVDMLDGGGGNDLIEGRGESDEVRGGLGRDRIFGGTGGDSISAVDRRRDVIRCGRGRDRVKADRRDRLPGCERVRRSRSR
jgi:Ca2+-binding RTX toxin-like protein